METNQIDQSLTVIGNTSQPLALYIAVGYFSRNCSEASITIIRDATPICGAASPTKLKLRNTFFICLITLATSLLFILSNGTSAALCRRTGSPVIQICLLICD